ncbi:MAG: late competence development ComFB family protein [Gammaproteobacteria bacterium]|nr:late competence development ComFB family protein [Gammaproteobacteria bacterium]
MAFEISNIYEELVIDRITEKLAGTGEFDHDKLEDIACLALNRLPAKYVRFPVDAAASMSAEEHVKQDILIDNAIEYGIEIVRTRRHDQH